MQYSEFIECVEATLDWVDELCQQLFVSQTFDNDDVVNYHGYVCGYGRALAEFIERGPSAEYWDVHQSFNRHVETNDEWFQEGLVAGLASCIKAYISVVE